MFSVPHHTASLLLLSLLHLHLLSLPHRTVSLLLLFPPTCSPPLTAASHGFPSASLPPAIHLLSLSHRTVSLPLLSLPHLHLLSLPHRTVSLLLLFPPTCSPPLTAASYRFPFAPLLLVTSLPVPDVSHRFTFGPVPPTTSPPLAAASHHFTFAPLPPTLYLLSLPYQTASLLLLSLPQLDLLSLGDCSAASKPLPFCSSRNFTFSRYRIAPFPFCSYPSHNFTSCSPLPFCSSPSSIFPPLAAASHRFPSAPLPPVTSPPVADAPRRFPSALSLRQLHLQLRPHNTAFLLLLSLITTPVTWGLFRCIAPVPSAYLTAPLSRNFTTCHFCIAPLPFLSYLTVSPLHLHPRHGRISLRPLTRDQVQFQKF